MMSGNIVTPLQQTEKKTLKQIKILTIKTQTHTTIRRRQRKKSQLKNEIKNSFDINQNCKVQFKQKKKIKMKTIKKNKYPTPTTINKTCHRIMCYLIEHFQKQKKRKNNFVAHTDRATKSVRQSVSQSKRPMNRIIDIHSTSQNVSLIINVLKQGN